MAAANKSALWEKHVGMLTSKVVSGAAILPIQPEGPASQRKSVICAQKGISIRLPEATALVDAVMDGKVHLDYVAVGGQQYLLTTVGETAYYGQSTSAKGGIVLVKTRRLLIVAIYSEPTTMAQAIPHVHSFAEELDGVQQQ